MWSCFCIYICPVFSLSVVVHSLALLSLPSVHSNFVYILLRGKLYLFIYFFLYRFSKFHFAVFFLCPLNNQTSPFIFIIIYFLTVFSSLFINLHIVNKSFLSLLSLSVVSCIFFNHSTHVRSSNHLSCYFLYSFKF